MSKYHFIGGAALLVILSISTSYVAANRFVVCYYGTWATYRWGEGQFNVEHIDPHMCTHAIYTFVGIDQWGNVISLDPWLDLPDDWGRNNFGEFNALKHRNPGLKTILAVGGWNEGSAKYSVMAANPEYRRNFVNTALRMTLDYGFDGFDVDWEYPNQRDTVHGQADIDNFTQLLRELREEFDRHGLLITAAVASVQKSASLSYDIPAISRYLDLISIMAYDLNGSWDDRTGHNAPLHRGIGDDDTPWEDLFTVDAALQYWVDQGTPLSKIALGVPFYGRTFNLRDPHQTGVRAPAAGPGLAGPWTAQPGTIGYNEFCTRLQSEPWVRMYDDRARVPYAYLGQNWVTYDDVPSIIEKSQFAMSRGVAGVMVWSVETDDFHGYCGGGNFPLLRAVNGVVRSRQAFNSSSVVESP